MKALIDTADKKSERAFLVGVELKSQTAWDVADSLDELAELANTAGVAVVGQGTQRLEAPHSGTFIGAGKAEEFAKAAKEANADTVLFDEELSGAQARNLEEIFGAKVIDRTALILDIFAQRARTREGKLQVELAQLQYLMPRLTRYWTHLSRQRAPLAPSVVRANLSLRLIAVRRRSASIRSATSSPRFGGSDPPSAKDVSATSGLWPRSWATPTRANPRCSML